jgi:ribosomal protein S18 acetylase RimI-like enzyme
MHEAFDVSAGLSIRRAATAYAPRVQAVISDAARGLLTRGIRQWEWFLTPEGHEHIARRIEEHEVYLVARDGNLEDATATVTVQWSDREFWGDRGDDGAAVYVHGLAVRPAFAGRAIGAKLIDFAAERARQRGRSLVRLDCMASNAKLRAYYAGLGFELVETRCVHGRFESALLERAVSHASDKR